MSWGDRDACNLERINLSFDEWAAWMPALVPRRKKRSNTLCLKLRITSIIVTCYVTRVKLTAPSNGLAHWRQVTGALRARPK